MDSATYMTVRIITPYVNEQEITAHKQAFWKLNVIYERDIAGIGSDLMFQRMWECYPQDDIFILHADMYPHHDTWFDEVLEYVNAYPEAGMFGCLLLYPAKDINNNYYIQSAGGRFVNNRPDHFGSGLDIENNTQYKQFLEVDNNQYDKVREVAWTTFGGCYLRRSFIKSVGRFSPSFEWTYNRDVDFCLQARAAGQKIYQIPVRLFHTESRDNKTIKTTNPQKLQAEMRNLQRLQNKWSHTAFYTTMDNIVE